MMLYMSRVSYQIPNELENDLLVLDRIFCNAHLYTYLQISL